MTVLLTITRGAFGRKQLLSPKAQQYETAFLSALGWRSLFRTEGGLIGMGPSWMSSGDRLMLVRNAIVPYVFRHVDEDLRQQVEALKKKVEKLEKQLLERSSLNKKL